MRICVVYDCLYPWTVGGAERWLRNLAEALVGEGHEVTYLTRRQWPKEAPPRIPGINVIGVSRQEPLYGPKGQRRIAQPIRFGWGVFSHLAGHRSSYDVVHTAAFPYFSLLGAAAALKGSRTRIVADWYEVWSKDYWRTYLGGLGGFAGWLVQRACARVRHRAFVFSELHRQRLCEAGLKGEPIKLTGLYLEDATPAVLDIAGASGPLVVFAGRHTADKCVTAIPPAIAVARKRVPGLRAVILGDGPASDAVRVAVARSGVGDITELPGFVDRDAVRSALARATCLLLPSRREGYGLVIVEAAAVGTPSIVVAGADNAAVELVDEGINGFVVSSSGPDELADAIIATHAAGAKLRASTLDWFTSHAMDLSLATSLKHVVASYRTDANTKLARD